VNDEIRRALENMPEEAIRSAYESRWMSQLSAETRLELIEFEEWLVRVERKAPTTAQPYKSYVASALVRLLNEELWEDLNGQQRAAMQAFLRFQDDRQETTE
jgi:hypothetical protein